MSSPETADRRVAGLGRRRAEPNPARLIAANRPTPQVTNESPATDPERSTRQASTAPGTPPDSFAEPMVTPLRTHARRSDTRPRATPPSAENADDGTDAPRKLTVYMHPSIRDRAAVAFKATAYLEQDDSWSHMVEKAVLAEVERREAAHNAGQPFSAPNAKLKRGRGVR